jgi:hypothetical protein
MIGSNLLHLRDHAIVGVIVRISSHCIPGIREKDLHGKTQAADPGDLLLGDLRGHEIRLNIDQGDPEVGQGINVEAAADADSDEAVDCLLFGTRWTHPQETHYS